MSRQLIYQLTSMLLSSFARRWRRRSKRLLGRIVVVKAHRRNSELSNFTLHPAAGVGRRVHIDQSFPRRGWAWVLGLARYE